MGEKKTILIVEDCENNLDLCVQILEDDYEILTARDGQEGVDLALRKEPDLILMDLSLPIKNGWEATREIKKKNEATLIIALTAHALAGDEERARAAGCDYYITKPFNVKDLTSAIEELLNK